MQRGGKLQRLHKRAEQPSFGVERNIIMQNKSAVVMQFAALLLPIKAEYKTFFLGLTCLLGEGGGLALAVVRHRDHADVVVDAGLQAVQGVLAGRRQDKVLEDGHALAGRRHGDPVAGDGGGVEGQPAEADAGVAHVLEGDVAHLRHF